MGQSHESVMDVKIHVSGQRTELYRRTFQNLKVDKFVISKLGHKLFTKTANSAYFTWEGKWAYVCVCVHIYLYFVKYSSHRKMVQIKVADLYFTPCTSILNDERKLPKVYLSCKKYGLYWTNMNQKPNH